MSIVLAGVLGAFLLVVIVGFSYVSLRGRDRMARPADGGSLAWTGSHADSSCATSSDSGSCDGGGGD